MYAKAFVFWKLLWASPTTLVGLTVGGVGLMTGGRVQRTGRILEFWGGGLDWSLRKLTLLEYGAAAMTLGHVVIARSRADLDRCRAHELIHVRQCERWGPFFLPAYVSCSAYLWLVGRDVYYDNPFEREAFDCHDPRDS